MTTYQVADLYFSFDDKLNILAQKLNYIPFNTNEGIQDRNYLFHLTIDLSLRPSQKEINFSYTNEIGCYGVTCKDQTYEWILKKLNSETYYLMTLDIKSKEAKINFNISDLFTLQAADDFTRFAFIYTAAFHDTVLLHASCIMNKDKGIAFMGKSGIGKSTHSSLWIRYIEGSELLNDDQPAVRLINGLPIIFGTPWSGKTDCYKSKCVPLKAILCMEQKSYNKLIPIPKIKLFTNLLGSCSLIKTEKTTLRKITDTLAKIVEYVPGGILQNKPEEEAAVLSYNFFINNKTMHHDILE